jgi:hypothetical protein
MQWLFKKQPWSLKNPSSQQQRIRQGYMVRSSDDDDDSCIVFESEYDAIVECKRRELMSSRPGDGDAGGKVVNVVIRGPSKDASIVKKAIIDGKNCEFDDLPRSVQQEIEKWEAAKKLRLDAESDERKRIADLVRCRWTELGEEFDKQVEERTRIKDKAIKAYISERSMTSARVREICDEQTSQLNSAMKRMHEKGRMLVEAAAAASTAAADDDETTTTTAAGRGCDVTLDDLVVRGLLQDLVVV